MKRRTHTNPARQEADYCSHCSKWLYSESRAYRAALAMASVAGRPFRIYRCPVKHRAFHITKEPKRESS